MRSSQKKIRKSSSAKRKQKNTAQSYYVQKDLHISSPVHPNVSRKYNHDDYEMSESKGNNFSNIL
jgi:hypothetical protein